MSDEPEPAPDRGRDDTRTPARRRWVWRAVGATCAAALIPLFVWQLGARERTKREGERELAAARAEAERDDPDWTWERLNAARPKPPKGKNGAELIPRIKKLTHPDWGKVQIDPRWMPKLDAEPNVRYAPEVLREVRRELAASAEAVALARELKNRPFGHREIVLSPNVIGTVIDDTQHTRHVADLLRWDVAVAIEDGDPRRARDGLLALINASRSIGDEPYYVSQLVRMAVRSVAVSWSARVLAQATDTPDLLDLQDALAADAGEPLLLLGTRGERAAFDRFFENLESGALSPDEVLDPSPPAAENWFGWRHPRANLLADRAYTLTWMTRFVEHARLPIHEQPAAFATLPVPPPDRRLSASLIISGGMVAEAYWRSTAETRCAVAGIACERFRQRHGRWPAALTDLIPGFLPAVPLDPYNGGPLQYVKWDHGVVVHSLGIDSRRAGAGDDPPDPLARHPRFRLWDPDQRRQPPPPDPPAPEPDP